MSVITTETVLADDRTLVALILENEGNEESRMDAIRTRFENAEKRRNGEPENAGQEPARLNRVAQVAGQYFSDQT